MKKLHIKTILLLTIILSLNFVFGNDMLQSIEQELTTQKDGILSVIKVIFAIISIVWLVSWVGIALLSQSSFAQNLKICGGGILIIAVSYGLITAISSMF